MAKKNGINKSQITSLSSTSMSCMAKKQLKSNIGKKNQKHEVQKVKN
jgi:hypothetical protein